MTDYRTRPSQILTDPQMARSPSDASPGCQRLWDQTGDLSNRGFLAHPQRSAEFRAGAAQDANSDNSCDFGSGILINALVTGVFLASTAPNPLHFPEKPLRRNTICKFSIIGLWLGLGASPTGKPQPKRRRVIFGRKGAGLPTRPHFRPLSGSKPPR